MNLTDWAGAAYRTSVIAQGTSKGAPVPLEMAVKSWLQDGSIVVTQGYDNRTVNLRVNLRASSLTAVANAEAALFAELGKPNLLTWTPASGPATVFVVITSSMEESPQESGDLAENQAFPWRTYNVRLLCEAFTQSVAEVTIAALGSGTQTVIPTPTSVTVDSGSSTTGWTGNYYRWDTAAHTTLISSGSTTMSVLSGAVNSVSAANPAGPIDPYMRVEAMRTGSVDVSVTKQIVVNWQWDVAGTPYPWVSTNFQLLVNEATTPVFLTRVSGTPAPGRLTYTEATFIVPSSLSTINTMRFIVDLNGFPTTGQVESLYIDSVIRNNANTSISTPRELQRTISVAGSARTQGRVTISHETSALGDVLAYFWPDLSANYSPPLRQFRSAGGGVTADTTLVSGARENLVAATTVFTIPASRVPDGGYLLMARLGGAATTATLTWTATTILNSVDIGPTSTGTRVAPITTAYQNIAMARIVLPTNNVNPQATTAQVKITLTATVSSGSTANLDEAWIFGDFGQLTQVACGTASPSSGGSSNRVFIRPATSTFPQPSVRLGFASDETDASSPSSLSSWQPPEFKPSLTNVYTATSNALDAAVTLYHFPRWHTNAAS